MSLLNKSAVRWRCRRGMLELDVLLSRFFERHYDKLSDSEKVNFASLLDVSDPVLWDWLVLAKPVEALDLQALVSKIRQFEVSS